MKTLVIALGALLLPSVAFAASAPRLSPADLAMLKEDGRVMGLVPGAKPPRIIPDSDPEAKAERLASCLEYWEENIHRNRDPNARQVVMAVRVARCMWRTHYTVINGPCKPQAGGRPVDWRVAVQLTKEARCYAKFQ